MPDYYLKYLYPWAGNLYHIVTAPNKSTAIRRFIKGTRIPAHKVHVWRGRGKPALLSGWSGGRDPSTARGEYAKRRDG